MSANTPTHLRGTESKISSEKKRSPSQSIPHVDLAGIQQDPSIDFAEFKSFGKGLVSTARVTADGRISIDVDLKNKLPDLPPDYARDVKEFAVDEKEWRKFPRMNIVIMIVGSRGDVQPYLALGKRLIQDGHRVRLATHETFRGFVTDGGLEFFAIGGNPQDLMSYMVKNPGLMPGFTSLTNGDIKRKRIMLAEMMNGCWDACHSPDPQTGKRFAADAIISNPPAFAHVHCAEALGIPLLMSFTMPWCPTTEFPHPLVNVKESNAEYGLTNYLSYALAELLTWQGTGDLVNTLRSQSLGLEQLTMRSGPAILDRLKVPWTYCMSPALVPKPPDWKNHIDVVGFYFLDLGTDFRPPDDLAAFLAKGEPPVYIGFGSVVVEDSATMTKTIFDAAAKAGVRALVSAGWGGLGGVSVPEHIFILGNIPHDWLFANGRVTAVVHHGGAGTTSAGLKMGLPTVVVPFFGDQGFWGSMIHKAGAGPAPIPHKKLDADNLSEAIKFAISPQAKIAAQMMRDKILNDDGLRKGTESFYKHLPLMNMRCDLTPDRLAVWWSTEHCLKLSALSAQTLENAGELRIDSLDPHRPKEYDSIKQVTDPITGGTAAIFWTVTHYYASIAEIFYSPIQGVIDVGVAIPKGVVQIVKNIHEGMENVPRLYGSQVRKRGKVTDATTGFKEAGKGLFYGYYDGITGLYKEPIAGAKKEGFAGFVKGAGRSWINATLKPAAGIAGVVALPFNGLWKSVQNTLGRKQEQKQRPTRILDGRDDFERASKADKDAILSKFRQLKATTGNRRKEWGIKAAKALDTDPEAAQLGMQPEHMTSQNTLVGTPSASQAPTKAQGQHSSSVVTTPAETPASEYDEAAFEEETRKAIAASQTELLDTKDAGNLPEADTMHEDDSSYERDLKIAMELSLAEQRGYERGIAASSSN